VLPTWKAFRELKNWYFTMKFLPHHHLYVSNACTKFQGQKIYQKKIFKSTNMCSCEMFFSAANFDNLLKIECVFLAMKILKWNHLYVDNVVSNFKYKSYTQKKILEIYQHVLLRRKFSLLLTLTPSQGLKNCFFAIKFLARAHLYVGKMCDKFQGQEIHSKKYIRNLLTCMYLSIEGFNLFNFD